MCTYHDQRVISFDLHLARQIHVLPLCETDLYTARQTLMFTMLYETNSMYSPFLALKILTPS